MTSLFPSSERGFEAKAPDGVLSRYCARCGAHLDLHGTEWRTAEGSLRTCPPVDDAAGRYTYPDEAEESREPMPKPQSRSTDFVANPPFGTDFNASQEAIQPGKGRRHVSPARGDQRPVVSTRRSYVSGSLKGTGVDPSSTVTDADTRKPVPCRRSNGSSFVGAGVQH